MKKLNEAVLQIGDIILTTTDLPVSQVIRGVTKSDISHALVYVQAYSVIDSTGDGVQARSTQRLYWEDRCAVHVYRYRGVLDSTASRQLVDFVRGRIGTRYSVREAIRSVIPGTRAPSERQFCSRLVAQAYASVGIDLVDDPDYCAPEVLQKSALLIEVEDALQLVTPAHLRAMEAIPDGTKTMREATAFVLEGARERNPSIEDFTDIRDHLYAHPEDDAYIADLYQRSGYLTLWKSEFDVHPEHYELGRFTQSVASHATKRAYCIGELNDGEEGLVRFEQNLAAYTECVETAPLETFKLLKTLYRTLVNLTIQRREVAAEWLREQDAVPAEFLARPTLLEPHTEEWFRSLASVNVGQAQHTRGVIARAESVAVCSICGDAPTRDYRVLGDDIPKHVVSTLRLCSDCVRIRGAGGEALALLSPRSSGQTN